MKECKGTLEYHKTRVEGALQKVWTVAECSPTNGPGKHPEHVFDIEDVGLRLIVSRDSLAGEICLHVSASILDQDVFMGEMNRHDRKSFDVKDFTSGTWFRKTPRNVIYFIEDLHTRRIPTLLVEQDYYLSTRELPHWIYTDIGNKIA